MDGDGVTIGSDEAFEWDWVRVYELILPDNTKTIGIDHSPDVDPWKMQGMLQAAADYYRAMTTNLFFENDSYLGECDCEECNPDD